MHQTGWNASRGLENNNQILTKGETVMNRAKWHIRGSIDNIDETDLLQRLYDAIIADVSQDYVNYLAVLMEEPSFDGKLSKRAIFRTANKLSKKERRELAKCWEFLDGSEGYYSMTKIDHEYLLRKLNEEARDLFRQNRKEAASE